MATNENFTLLSCEEYAKKFRYHKKTKHQNVRPGHGRVSRVVVRAWLDNGRDGNGKPIELYRIGKRVFVKTYKNA